MNVWRKAFDAEAVNEPQFITSPAVLWSAPAERSGDGAFRARKNATPAHNFFDRGKAVSRSACHRTPYKISPRFPRSKFPAYPVG